MICPGDPKLVYKESGPGLDASLKALEPGHTVVIRKRDRLGRDLKYLAATVDMLRNRRVGLPGRAGAEIDTMIANGRWVLGICANPVPSECERIAELAGDRARWR